MLFFIHHNRSAPKMMTFARNKDQLFEAIAGQADFCVILAQWQFVLVSSTDARGTRSVPGLVDGRGFDSALHRRDAAARGSAVTVGTVSLLLLSL